MFFSYEVQQPTGKKRGVIKLNGELLFWGALESCKDLLHKSNVWERTKLLTRSVLRGNVSQARRTRLYSFILLNKLHDAQYLTCIPNGHMNYTYIACPLVGSDYYQFVVYLSARRQVSDIMRVKNLPPVSGGNNVYYSAFYDASQNLLTMIDPESKNQEQIVLESRADFRKRAIEDFLRLQPRDAIIQNEPYLLADLGDGYKVALSKRIIEEKDQWFTVTQSDGEMGQIRMNDIYIEVPTEGE